MLTKTRKDVQIRRSPASLRIILLGSWMSVQHLLTIHLVQSGGPTTTNQHCSRCLEEQKRFKANRNVSLLFLQIWEDCVNKGHPGQEHQPVQRSVNFIHCRYLLPFKVTLFFTDSDFDMRFEFVRHQLRIDDTWQTNWSIMVIGFVLFSPPINQRPKVFITALKCLSTERVTSKWIKWLQLVRATQCACVSSVLCLSTCVQHNSIDCQNEHVIIYINDAPLEYLYFDLLLCEDDFRIAP